VTTNSKLAIVMAKIRRHRLFMSLLQALHRMNRLASHEEAALRFGGAKTASSFDKS
jgi:hypothetical protein